MSDNIPPLFTKPEIDYVLNELLNTEDDLELETYLIKVMTDVHNMTCVPSFLKGTPYEEVGSMCTQIAGTLMTVLSAWLVDTGVQLHNIDTAHVSDELIKMLNTHRETQAEELRASVESAADKKDLN